MKKLGKLKLNQLSKVEIAKREMSSLKGGICQCACVSGNNTVNGNANAGGPGDEDDLQSPEGGYCYQNNVYWTCVSGY